MAGIPGKHGGSTLPIPQYLEGKCWVQELNYPSDEIRNMTSNQNNHSTNIYNVKEEMGEPQEKHIKYYQ